MTTLVLHSGLAMALASPEGVSAARGVLGLFAAVAFGAFVLALHQVKKVVTTLLRLLLVMIAVAAFGATAIAIIAQVYLIIGPM